MNLQATSALMAGLVLAAAASGQEAIYSNITNVQFDPDFGDPIWWDQGGDINLDDLHVADGAELTSITYTVVNIPRFGAGTIEGATATLSLFLDDGDGNPDDDGDRVPDADDLIFETTLALPTMFVASPQVFTLDVTGAGITIPAGALVWAGLAFDDGGAPGENLGQVGYYPPTLGTTDPTVWTRFGFLDWFDTPVSLGWELEGTPLPDPCAPADLDGNGVVTVLDLLTFLRNFFDGAPAADLDGSGDLNVLDLLAFLDLWFDCRVGRPPVLGGGG